MRTETRIWQKFKPSEAVTSMDFNLNAAVFYRNMVFCNRINIGRIKLTHGEVDIQTMETRTSMPIEDNVAIAVIPGTGFKCIRTGETCITVPPASE